MNRKPPSIGYDERMTPTHAALLPVLTNSLNMLREALDGLPDEATAWTPAPNTNSLTVLTMHSLTSLRFFLGNGSGRVTEISRYRAEDRAEAFASKPESAASLIAHIDAALPGYRAILEGGTEADLTAAISWPPEDAPNLPATGAGCLFHAIGHCREHVGQAMLMRDLWLNR